MVTNRLAADQRVIRSGGMWAFAGKFSTSIMTLVINATLARVLFTEELGLYFLIFNIALFGAYLSTLGFEQTIVKFIANNLAQNKPGNISYIVKIAFFGTLAGSMTVSVTYYFSADLIEKYVFNVQGLSALTLVLVFWMISNGFQVLIGEAFRGFQEIKLATVFGGLASTMIFISMLTLTSQLGWINISIQDVVILWIISITGSNLIGFIILLKKLSIIRSSSNKDIALTVSLSKMVPVTLPLMVTALSYFFITQADIWIISIIGSPHDIAIYGAAAKLAILMSMPFIILNSVIQPIIASKFAAGKIKEFEKMLRVLTALAFVPAFLLFIIFLLLGENILRLIFGSEVYGSGVIILIILALKHLITIWSGTAANLLAMTGFQRKLMIVTILTGVASMSAASWAGLHYGSTGVALGFLIPGVLSQLYIVYSVYQALNVKGYADFRGIYGLVRREIVRIKLAKRLI
ncbi:lipopolysaccharide biosynthesis protein [Jeotgalibacillus sp. R-1-5s-1]|uniref:lipopolysaccharide biosynthesis protein n=1 Tax=Jeotgalibacillus sp. R-1-5s-1 TaxID=2555897 RepID=UPI001069F954|nr:oligosaccharide flippase family protein [Jeotgalibacillus sp. R-1-5s-1]TFE00020.1 hypothetical protein E2491_06140 [Jeotgalibacillus sp. R-1-5s-1]